MDIFDRDIVYEGALFQLRPVQVSDSRAMYRIRRQPQVKHTLSEKVPASQLATSTYILRMAANKMQKIGLGIVIAHPQTDEMIGYVECMAPGTVKPYLNWHIRFYLDTAYTRQGIMTNALAIVLKHLQQYGISTIMAHAEKSNHAARNVLDRLGFTWLYEDEKHEVFAYHPGGTLMRRTQEYRGEPWVYVSTIN